MVEVADSAYRQFVRIELSNYQIRARKRDFYQNTSLLLSHALQSVKPREHTLSAVVFECRVTVGVVCVCAFMCVENKRKGIRIRTFVGRVTADCSVRLA